RSAHVGGKLIYLLDPLNCRFHDIGIPQVCLNKLVGRRRREFVTLDIDSANPVSFGFQPFYQMTADKSTGAIDQNTFHVLPNEMVEKAPGNSQKHLPQNSFEWGGRPRPLCDPEVAGKAPLQDVGETAFHVAEKEAAQHEH